jgi:lipoate synthase
VDEWETTNLSLTSLEDARNNTTQNLFDQYGEPTQKTLPITTYVEKRTYDPAGTYDYDATIGQSQRFQLFLRSSNSPEWWLCGRPA